jgi:hypothetical protein
MALLSALVGLTCVKEACENAWRVGGVKQRLLLHSQAWHCIFILICAENNPILAGPGQLLSSL